MQRRGKATLYELMRKGVGDPTPSRPSGAGFSLGSGAIEPRRPWKAWAILGVLVAVAVVVVGIVLLRDGASNDAGSGARPAPAPGTSLQPAPSANGAPASTPALSTAKPALPATAGGDPRKAGLNYLVVMTGAATPAGELAAFLRGKGLDAWQVSGNNAGLSKVIVLPASTTGSDQAAEALRNEVKAVGRLWKAAKAGNPDLSDCYYEKYKG
ncbi:MAG: hypothetical protein KGR22_00300 [Planctomycetes bacterium]|nr:hypothetical protein [Planctomycetota bacterium]